MIPTIHTALPKIYLRAEVSDRRIKELKEVWKSAQSDVKKGQPPCWPFDALDVRQIQKPTKEQKEQGVIYEVVDGVHRRQMALEIPVVYLPARIHEDLDDRAAALMQWERTTKSALNFSRKDRDAAIRTLAVMMKIGEEKGTTQKLFADRLMLSESTVSRVLKAKEKAPHGGARAWNDQSWFNRVYKLSAEYSEHFDSIKTHMTTSFPDHAADFIETFNRLYHHMTTYPTDQEADESKSES